MKGRGWGARGNICSKTTFYEWLGRTVQNWGQFARIPREDLVTVARKGARTTQNNPKISKADSQEKFNPYSLRYQALISIKICNSQALINDTIAVHSQEYTAIILKSPLGRPLQDNFLGKLSIKLYNGFLRKCYPRKWKNLAQNSPSCWGRIHLWQASTPANECSTLWHTAALHKWSHQWYHGNTVKHCTRAEVFKTTGDCWTGNRGTVRYYCNTNQSFKSHAHSYRL